MNDAICPWCGKPRHRDNPESPWCEERAQENECLGKARDYANRVCYTHCIRRDIGLKPGENWHEWPCTECAANPYNILPYKQAAPDGAENAKEDAHAD